MNSITRVPPHNLEAETSVLGAMLLDNSLIDDVAVELKSDDFYTDKHKIVYQAILDVYAANQAVDLVMLRAELVKRDCMDDSRDIEFLFELEETVPVVSNVMFYASIVKSLSAKRKILNLSLRTQELVFNLGSDEKQLAEYVENEILAISNNASSACFVDTGELSASIYDRLSDMYAGKIAFTGIKTGFCDLDELIGGLQPSELIVVAARPSMGKSTLALNIAHHVAIKDKHAVALFSIEMSAMQILQNIVCSMASIESGRMKKGLINDEEWPRISGAFGEITSSPLFIDDSTQLTLFDLRARARRLKEKSGLKLIIVDYLQLMTCPGAESRQREVSIISQGLKALAKDLEVPVIAVAQLNRSVESREGKRPKMSDLRESGSIEQDADLILLLHRDDYYRDGGEKDGIAEFIVAKQRNGAVGVVRTVFISQHMQFRSYAKGVYADADCHQFAGAY